MFFLTAVLSSIQFTDLLLVIQLDNNYAIIPFLPVGANGRSAVLLLQNVSLESSIVHLYTACCFDSKILVYAE